MVMNFCCACAAGIAASARVPAVMKVSAFTS
jgi:hypothetical protein